MMPSNKITDLPESKSEAEAAPFSTLSKKNPSELLSKEISAGNRCHPHRPLIWSWPVVCEYDRSKVYLSQTRVSDRYYSPETAK